MRIGILGSGLIDGKLAIVFARAGHDVVFSYSRSRQKLERLARDAGAKRAREHRPRQRTTPTPSCSPLTGRVWMMY
jgi:predicted dinucleotide-binding enzyme